MIRCVIKNKKYHLLVESYSFPFPKFTLWWWEITGEIPLFFRGDPKVVNLSVYIEFCPEKTRKKKKPVLIKTVLKSTPEVFYSLGGFAIRWDYERLLMGALYTYALTRHEYTILSRIIILELKQRRYALIE